MSPVPSLPKRPAITKFVLLGCLYFSQGLPFGFFTQALPVQLRKADFSLGAIGLTSLLALPWALKFVWAPIVDRYSWPRFGRRRSWIVPLQLAGAAILASLAWSDTASSMTVLMAAVLLLNLVAATQDIATDGLAIDMLESHERGFANGLQVAGYRAGMIVGGGALLMLYDRLGAQLTFAAMAGLTLLATLPVLLSREPRPQLVAAPEHLVRARVHFLRRPGVWRVLALLVVYKFGDAFASGMLRPYLADIGLELAELGKLLGTVGFVAGLLGALVGGALVNRIGRREALVTFGIAQMLTVAGYAYLASGPPSLSAIYVLCAAEHLASGMATAALFTSMMDWCSAESSATDYTVQASTVVIATGVASMVGGFSAQALGYAAHFWLGAGLAFSALLVVWRCFPSRAQAEALRGEQPSEKELHHGGV